MKTLFLIHREPWVSGFVTSARFDRHRLRHRVERSMSTRAFYRIHSSPRDFSIPRGKERK